jgi:hypothetical protein
MNPPHAGRELRVALLQGTPRRHRRSVLALLSATVVAVGCLACGPRAATEMAGVPSAALRMAA